MTLPPNDNDALPGAHAHHFGQEQRRPGEARTLLVVALTVATMIVEITAGIAFGSMALLADGLHMGSHAVALGIAVFAYVYARRHARDGRFNFGTGKVNALGGFTGALLLAVFALMMAWASLERLFFPVEIAFNQAILVAVAGLFVNGVSVLILGEKGEAHGRHNHSHDPEMGSHHHQDHNLRSAYFHVLADALTSVFAIFALVSGKYFGWVWLDPFMGLVGAVLVAVWSKGLLVSTARVLLDMRAPEAVYDALRSCLEQDRDVAVTDLHVWSIGLELYAASINLATGAPQPPEHYHGLLPDDLGLVHVTIEVHLSLPTSLST